jgi:hypothetical protein
LILTGSADEHDQERARFCGAAGYVTKSLTFGIPAAIIEAYGATPASLPSAAGTPAIPRRSTAR